MMSWERDVLVKQEQMKDLLRQREEDRRFMLRENRPPNPRGRLLRVLASVLGRLSRLVLRRTARQPAPCSAEKEFVS